jgi:DNA-binding transcriptional LysR family regulator
VFPNAGYYGLADIVQRFHALYPDVKIRLTGRNSVLNANAKGTGLAGTIIGKPYLLTEIILS